MVRVVRHSEDERYSLRASMYEFKFDPVLEAFRIAHLSGADVQILYHKLGSVGEAGREAIKAARIKGLTIPRSKVSISHNKFVVLLKNGKPIEVWTGSTNVTEGGIYGHANVGHRISDPKVAAAYLGYRRNSRAIRASPTSGPLTTLNRNSPKAAPKAT